MKILTYYGGCGIEAIDPDSLVVLRCGDKGTIMKAKEVMEAYDKLTCEKAIWTFGLPAELVEAHFFVDSEDMINENELPF